MMVTNAFLENIYIFLVLGNLANVGFVFASPKL